MRTATRYQLPSAWLQTAAPHSRSQFCAGARSEDRASLQLKSHASAQGGNAAGLVGAVIGEGKTCQRPMPGIPGGAWSVGPHAIPHFWLLVSVPIGSFTDNLENCCNSYGRRGPVQNVKHLGASSTTSGY